MAGLTIRCLTNLATPQKKWLRRRESNSYQLVYKTSALNPIELRRKKFGGPGGAKTLTRSLQDFYAVIYITSPKVLVATGGVEPPT